MGKPVSIYVFSNKVSEPTTATFGERLHTTTFITKRSTGPCAGGKIEKNEVGGACGAYGGGERCAQGVGGETRGKEVIGETQT